MIVIDRARRSIKRRINALSARFGLSQSVDAGRMRTTARPEGEEIDVALARARRAWLQAMGPHASSSRHAVLPEIAMLQQSHLNGCTILANREVLIDRMKKNGIAVELGVDKGFFSEVIMRVAQPERLHLVDMDFSRFDPEKKLDRHVQDGRVLLHRGDSAKVISGFPPRHFDSSTSMQTTATGEYCGTSMPRWTR